MKKSFFWRNWTIASISLTLVFVNILLFSSLSTQPFPSIEVNSFQSKMSVSKDAQQMGIIPVTGGESDSLLDNFGSGWSLWVFSGTVLLYCLLLLLPQTDGTNPSS